MRLAGHELKLLNASVVLYVLAGAFLFHSLDEFGDSKVQQQQPNKLANDKLDKDVDRPQLAQPAISPFKGRELRRLRADSVRRMWNITNQLNILYESNWTELVLAELIQFERRLVQSLELASTTTGSVDEEDDKRNEENDDDHDDDKKRAAKKRTKAQELESEARTRSIKRSLVHSLATITTMSSPGTPEPRSSRGKLLTILYGSLGIPLLVLSLAKSGHHLARSSVNLLLLLRHYLLDLPLHYLCCSCNLFTCLRALGWCCCCCCCSYLCCLDNDKQKKCCDASRAPKLKLAPEWSNKSKRRRKGRRRRQSTQQPANSTSGQANTSFVIGFNVPAQEHIIEQQNQRAKSVRFSANSQQQAVERRLLTDNNDSDDSDSDQDDDEEQASYYSNGVFLTAIAILLVYIAIGAYYLARTQQMSLADALFACYAMLAANKLPEVFRLDGAEPNSSELKSNPFQYYKSISGGGGEEEGTSGRAEVAANNLTQLSDRVRRLNAGQVAGELFARGSLESLTLDAVYLLIGLNLISTCAHFARLWFKRAVKRRRRRRLATGSPSLEHHQQQVPNQNKVSSNCNGFAAQPGASHSLAGHYNEFAPNPFGVAQSNQCAAAAAAAAAHATTAHSPPHHMHQALDGSGYASSATIEPASQINLAELFVMQNNSNGNGNQPLHSDGSMTSDRSSSTAARSSLCAHHQSTLGLQVQSAPYNNGGGGAAHLELTSNGHHVNDDDDTNRMMRASCATLRPTQNGHSTARIRNSSSSLQLGPPPSNGQHDSMPRGARNHYQVQCQHSNGLEPDSSPNTLDTNSQTMSSLSSRAIVMKPTPRGQQQAAANFHEQQHVNLGAEKTIWFSDQSPHC